MRTAAVVILVAGGEAARAQCDAWSREFASPGGLGMNGSVADFADWNGSLYATGAFFEAGGARANYLARWTGSAWERVGTGGAFGGGGMDIPGSALAVYGGLLIVGGFFNSAGDVPAQQIVSWNGTTFVPLGAGITEGFRRVRCLKVIGSDLYAGGAFGAADGAPASNIARWNGSAWSPLGSGTDGEVLAIEPYAGNVVVGGRFASAGGAARAGIAVWTGSQWAGFAGGQTNSLGQVQTLMTEGSHLYVGGNFRMLGSASANDVAMWNGTQWNAMNGGLQGVGVGAITRYRGQLVVAGQFTHAGGRAIDNIAVWTGSEYLPMAEGLNLNVDAAMVMAGPGGGNDLWVGGGFFTLGDDTTPSSFIGRWGPTCAAEMTCDGFLDIFDYEEFVRAFEAGEPKADVAADGFVDGFDYDRYVELFESGCM